MKVHIFLTFLHLQSMELATMDSREVEIHTFGQFGQEELSSSLTLVMLDALIVNLEHRHYLSGKLLFKQLTPILHMSHPLCFFMKGTTADLALFETI